MAAPLPFSESELRLLQVLLKRKVRFMGVGRSAATLQGARRISVAKAMAGKLFGKGT